MTGGSLIEAALRERDEAVAALRRATASGDELALERAAHDVAVAASRWCATDVSERVDYLAARIDADVAVELAAYAAAAEVIP